MCHMNAGYAPAIQKYMGTFPRPLARYQHCGVTTASRFSVCLALSCVGLPASRYTIFSRFMNHAYSNIIDEKTEAGKGPAAELRFNPLQYGASANGGCLRDTL